MNTSKPRKSSKLSKFALIGAMSSMLATGIAVPAFAAGTNSVSSITPSENVRLTSFVNTTPKGNCSGTLIDATHVITAAHCFPGGADKAAVYAANNTSTAERYVSSSGINSSKVDLMPWGDIALITLNSAIPNTKAAVVNNKPIEFGLSPLSLKLYGRNLLNSTGGYVNQYDYAYSDATSKYLGFCASDCDGAANPNAKIYSVPRGTWDNVTSRNPGTGTYLVSNGLINKGDSGGGVFKDGKLVGVIFAGAFNRDGTSANIVYSNVIDEHLNTWLTEKGVNIARWGVEADAKVAENTPAPTENDTATPKAGDKTENPETIEPQKPNTPANPEPNKTDNSKDDKDTQSGTSNNSGSNSGSTGSQNTQPSTPAPSTPTQTPKQPAQGAQPNSGTQAPSQAHTKRQNYAPKTITIRVPVRQYVWVYTGRGYRLMTRVVYKTVTYKVPWWWPTN